MGIIIGLTIVIIVIILLLIDGFSNYIEERKAFYEKNKEYEPIAKLNGEDLLYLLEKMYTLEEDSLFFDENINEIVSEPDRIVYEEILKQLKKFLTEKQSIQDELNHEFIELDKMLK